MAELRGEGSLSRPEPLAPDHDTAPFNSGVPALDAWLKRRARPNEAAGTSRTFVVSEAGRVIGYYSLAAASIMHAVATGNIRRNMPDPVPAVLIGRLALDLAYRGRGIGAALLQDAVLRIAGAADTVGVRAILVHAKSDEAKNLYRHFGFRPSPIEAMTLMMTLDEVRRTIGRDKLR